MYNILINNLSLYNPRNDPMKHRSKYLLNVDEMNYLTEEERTFEGIYTNEPITHALIRKMAKGEDSEILNCILSLTTQKVQECGVFSDNNEEYIPGVAEYLGKNEKDTCILTHYKFYESLVEKWIASEYGLKNSEITEIKEKKPSMEYEKISNIPEATDIHKAVVKMADKLIDIYEKHPEGCCLYMDYTGGDRSASTILIALTKMLEERGILIDHIWAVNFDESSSRNEIREKIEVNYIFDFISGLHEFGQYGRANTLNDYLKKSTGRENTILSPQEQEVQKKIDSLANTIQLCQSGRMKERINELIHSIEDYEKYDKEKNPMFQYLIQDIKNNYKEIYESKKRTIPNIIRWCLNKNLIQQAVTMYAELLPEYIVEKQILYYDNDNENWKHCVNSHHGFKEEYIYLNYHIWGDDGKAYNVAKRAGYVSQKNDNIFEQYKKKAEQITKYIKEQNLSESDVQCKNIDDVSQQLENLLQNYMLFKKKIRHSMNHAAKEQINVSELSDYMIWKNEHLFDGIDKNADITVDLLKKMMFDLLDQLDDMVKIIEKNDNEIAVYYNNSDDCEG